MNDEILETREQIMQTRVDIQKEKDAKNDTSISLGEKIAHNEALKLLKRKLKHLKKQQTKNQDHE